MSTTTTTETAWCGNCGHSVFRDEVSGRYVHWRRSPAETLGPDRPTFEHCAGGRWAKAEVMQGIRPEAGDVVRLDGDWWGAETGSHGVINGGDHYGPDDAMVVFNLYGGAAFRGPASAHAPDQRPSVSCSGGPCPAIPKKDLRYVGTVEQRFWRWKDIPRADGGEEYTETVSLWSWAGAPPSGR